MKLSGVRDQYYFHSGKVSDIIRQMALAGIGLVWIFKFEENNQPKIPAELIPATVLIVIGLTLDFLQYVTATLMWATRARKLENKGTTDDQEVSLPDWINYPALLFFWTKIPVIVSAYAVLIHFLWLKIK
jgi:hypothetical protein